MTNKEYYNDKIIEIACQEYTIAFDNKTNKIVACNGLSCSCCKFANQGSCRGALNKWLYEEYKEPQVDWSKVKVDTPILVSNRKKDGEWYKRYFAKYENGKVYTFSDGCTSWTANMTCSWSCAKLYEEGIDD